MSKTPKTYRFGTLTLVEQPKRHAGHKEFMYEADGAHCVVMLHENGEGFKDPITGRRKKYYYASYSCDHGLQSFQITSEPTDAESINRRANTTSKYPKTFETERPGDCGYFPSVEETFDALKRNIEDRIALLQLWK